MQIATIPSSGERVPRLGLGTWSVFDVGADAARRATLARVLEAFRATGGRVIDTSPMYGTAEQVLGDLIAEHPAPTPWLATKVWTTGEAAGVAQVERSFALLRVTRLDLVQIHNLLEWKAHLRTLRRLKDDGRIRYLGITHYQAAAIDDVARIVRTEPLDFVQMNLSLAEPAAARSLLGLCAERGVAFIANRPFGGGKALRTALVRPLPAWCAEVGIASWAHYMLAWVLAHPEVTIAIPATGNPAHLAEFLAAASDEAPRVDARRLEAGWK